MNSNHSSIVTFQEKIYIILKYITFFGFIPLLWLGSIFYFLSGDIVYGIIEIAMGFLLLVCLLIKKIPNYRKKLIIIYTLYNFSVFLLITTGKAGGGFISIFAIIIFAAILFKYFDVKFLFSYNIVFFITLSILLYSGVFDHLQIYDYRDSWIIQVLVVNIAAFSIILLMRLITNTIQESLISQMKQKDYLDNIINSIDEGIMTLSIDLKITLIGKKVSSLLEIDDSYLGLEYTTFISKLKKRTPNKRECNDDIPYLNDSLADGQFSIYSAKKKELIYIKLKKGTLYNQNDQEYGYILYFLDITESLGQAHLVSYLENNDQLTGLYNHQYFDKELKKVFDHKEFPISVMMCDINGLKLINDSFGYETGQEVIKATGDYLKEGCPTGTIISRLEGGLFGAILPKTDVQIAYGLTSVLKEQSTTIKVDTIQLSVEFACSVLNNEFDQIKEIIKQNNAELARKKITSGNSIRYHTIDLIMQTLYEKNPRENKHSKRVSNLCVNIGQVIGLNREELEQLKIASLMHDIGKIGIPEGLLNKPGKLTDDEWETMKKHSEIGYRILNSVPEFSKVSLFVLQHQEKWDGSGYPQGLKGEEILLPARVIAVADAYDAMTSDRTYRTTMSKIEALVELKKNAGTQFDPDIIKVLFKNLDILD